MYSINGIPLGDYGITPGRAPGSNISVEGILDMPARLGKTYQSWGDENGVEPYVSAEDINYGGRKIVFYGLIKAGTKAFALQKTKDLYDQFSSFDDLVPLVTDWGTFQVYVKETISVDYLVQGWAQIKITFREPNVTNSETLPSGSASSYYHIDGVAFTQLGARVSKVIDNFDRAKTKDGKFTAYGLEGYKVTKTEANKVTVSLICKADNFTTLASNVQKLHKLLSMPDTRTMNVDGTLRECFNVDGFTVGKIRVWGNLAICELQFTMLMALEIQQAGIFQFLQTNSGEDIVTNDSENIEVI